MNRQELDEQYETLRGDLTNYALNNGRLAVVKAPPGSGKTFTLIEVLARLVQSGRRVAVAAQTNSQADDICRRAAATHPQITVTRFSSKGKHAPNDFPATALWVEEANALPHGPGITVATTAKWALTDSAVDYDVLAIDEAWQMSWADLMQCAVVSECFLMIGDPGQIPPVVTIDVRRWETSPRAPHLPAPEVVLSEPSLRAEAFVASLPACRRLPHRSVDFVRPFYDFEFDSYVDEKERGVELQPSHPWAGPLSEGAPFALTIPTPDHGPPLEVDPEIATAAHKVVAELLDSGAQVRRGGEIRQLTPTDIGVTSSHRMMNAALASAIGPSTKDVRVDTPERWQGLERPVMIIVHPLSGVTEPSAFDLETGRLCVMASRHEAALIVLTRDHVGDTLRNYVPSAEQPPGRPDIVGRGHQAHLAFWDQLTDGGLIQRFT